MPGALRRFDRGRRGRWARVARRAAMLTRALYAALWWLALPLLPLRLWWRGRREPGYRERIGERFGRYRADAVPPTRDVVWMHAVSLGETRAAAPLVERIARRASATRRSCSRT